MNLRFLGQTFETDALFLQHAMMLPVLTHHIRYHQCLMHLDKLIGYMFKERCLLQVRESVKTCVGLGFLSFFL